MHSPGQRALAAVMSGLCLLMGGCGGQTGKNYGYTVNDPTDANTNWRADIPLSYEQATNIAKCPIPLPASATKIQYLDSYVGSGRFVRFEAPVDEILKHVDFLIADSVRIGRRINPEPKVLTSSKAEGLSFEATQGEPIFQALWFDTDKITNGLIWGEDMPRYGLLILDKGRGIFYYRQ